MTQLEQLERKCLTNPSRSDILRLSNALRLYRAAVKRALDSRHGDGAFIGAGAALALAEDAQRIEAAEDGS